MTNRNKGIIILIVGAISSLWLIKSIPMFLQQLPRLPDPEASGHIMGIVANMMVTIVCIVYGVIVFRRAGKKSQDKSKMPFL